jgi:MFS family permease
MLIPLIVACALFMENLDSTALATALPAIAASLGESPLRLSLAITSYLFALAVFIPISGWVADRFGARRVFRLAIAIFVLGSILCGFSTTIWHLVLARTLQGMGGAMMVPVGRLVLLRSVAKADLVRAMAWLTMPALIGPMLGPPLGGVLTTYLSWRWIFWINVPIGVLGIVLVSLFIPNLREERPPPLNLLGFLLSAAGLLGLASRRSGGASYPGAPRCCCWRSASSGSGCTWCTPREPCSRSSISGCSAYRPSGRRSWAAPCSGSASARCRSSCR